jgi:serine/threonine kinase 32
LYALKYINKEKCIGQRAARNTVFERNLLVDLDYPLIVNLRYAFQDDENMFMVLDLMLGGDLKYHLHQNGAFPEEAVRIYAAEMVCGVEYLHSRGVVHRDIKPDNLLLDEAGHVHLTDFNVATYLPHDGSPLTSFSGTITYMGWVQIEKVLSNTS